MVRFLLWAFTVSLITNTLTIPLGLLGTIFRSKSIEEFNIWNIRSGFDGRGMCNDAAVCRSIGIRKTAFDATANL